MIKPNQHFTILVLLFRVDLLNHVKAKKAL